MERQTSVALAQTLTTPEVRAAGLLEYLRSSPGGQDSALFMLQPYRPGRIPVVFVHGTLSVPAEWADMVNEIWNNPLLGDLLHGDETRVWGDSAYSRWRDVIAEHAPRAKDFTNKNGVRNRPLSAEDKSKNRTKSKVRAKAEHPFLILKRIFGFNKVRYRGLDKNANRLFVACGFVNVYMARRRLLRPT